MKGLCIKTIEKITVKAFRAFTKIKQGQFVTERSKALLLKQLSCGQQSDHVIG